MKPAQEKIIRQVQFRGMTEADIPAGLRLCRASGWNQVEDDWRLFLRVNPRSCRVVEKAGDVVGTVATIRYGDRFSWLSMILVDPHHRGGGIGTQLLHEGLAILENEECIRLDATPWGRQIYSRHGFVEEYSLSRVVGTASGKRSFPHPGGVRPFRAADLDELMAYDSIVFGTHRSALILDLFQRAPEYAWVFEKNGSIDGYILGRPGFRYEHLGPVVAAGQDCARTLVERCLEAHPGRTFALDVSQLESRWTRWLTAKGFTEERAFVRMRRGINRYPGMPERQFAISGPEFG